MLALVYFSQQIDLLAYLIKLVWKHSPDLKYPRFRWFCGLRWLSGFGRFWRLCRCWDLSSGHSSSGGAHPLCRCLLFGGCFSSGSHFLCCSLFSSWCLGRSSGANSCCQYCTCCSFGGSCFRGSSSDGLSCSPMCSSRCSSLCLYRSCCHLGGGSLSCSRGHPLCCLLFHSWRHCCSLTCCWLVC